MATSLSLPAIPVTHDGHCPSCGKATRPDRVKPGKRSCNFSLCTACWVKTDEGRKFKREQRRPDYVKPRKVKIQLEAPTCPVCSRKIRRTSTKAGIRSSGLHLCYSCWRKTPESRAAESAAKRESRRTGKPSAVHHVAVCTRCIHFLNGKCSLGFPDVPIDEDDCPVFTPE